MYGINVTFNQQIGLLVEAIGSVLSADRIVDTGRITANITGDAVGTLIVT